MKERTKTFFRNAIKKTQAFLREIWLKLHQLSENLTHILVPLINPMILFLISIALLAMFEIFDLDLKLKCLFGTDNKKETLAYVGIMIGGLIVLQRARSAEKHAEAMTEAACNQAIANKLVEVGHRQERLKTAIEHLGNDKESVRIGAAYELYHLAKDQSNFEETICRILCGHVRQKTQEEECQERYSNKPSEEIQTLIDILCRNKEHIFNKYINLSPSFLRGADLQEAQLQGASLQRAQLQGANLQGAQLQGASLHKAQLQGARLLEVRLQGAFLWKTQLQGSYLLGAQLHGANLEEAQLHGANLEEAQLHGASLQRAQMQGTNLHGVQLQGANLQDAQLQGVHSNSASYDFFFEERIRGRAEKDSELGGVVFSGGLDKEQVTKIIESMPSMMSDEEKKELREELSQHVGKSKRCSRNLLEKSGAKPGVYTREQAEKWIQEYEKAMRSVPDSLPPTPWDDVI